MKIKYLWYRQSSSLRVLAIFLGYHSAAFFLASQDSFWIGTKSLKSVKNGRGSRFSVYDLLHPLRCLRTCIPRKTHQSGGEKCRFAVHHCPASPCHVSFEMIGRWVGLGGATPSLFHLILEATERECSRPFLQNWEYLSYTLLAKSILKLWWFCKKFLQQKHFCVGVGSIMALI